MTPNQKILEQKVAVRIEGYLQIKFHPDQEYPTHLAPQTLNREVFNQ